MPRNCEQFFVFIITQVDVNALELLRALYIYLQ